MLQYSFRTTSCLGVWLDMLDFIVCISHSEALTIGLDGC